MVERLLDFSELQDGRRGSQEQDTNESPEP